MNVEEKAEYDRDCQIDDRMCEGLCIRCAREMPKDDYIPLTSIGRPAKCPICAPNQWKEANPLWNEDAVEKAAKKSHEQYGAAYKELANR